MLLYEFISSGYDERHLLTHFKHETMTTTYDIDLFDGHLIFEDNGLKILVDTGSPVTIGRTQQIDFMQRQEPCMTALYGIDIPGISDMLGYDIDVLMGMDILGKYLILTDYKQKQVTFSDEEISLPSSSSVLLTQGPMGVVCLDLTVKGKLLKVALDTGAKISYIKESMTADETQTGIKDDFNPMTGKFKTPIFDMDAEIVGLPFNVQFGILPPLLATSLQLAGIEGVIGYDLFNTFKVMMDFKKNKMHVCE